MAEVAVRPIVGITGPRTGAWGPRFCTDIAIRFAGGKPLHLRPGQELPDPWPDAVVITGGHDVEPVLYREEAKVAGRYDADRDRFESEVIGRSLQEGIPLLGICRGAQLINVVAGGSLIQDLELHRVQTSRRSTLLPLKTLIVESGSRLHAILGSSKLCINSLHNQAIDRVGNRLSVAGRDLDDIVQAVEGDGPQLVIGVQWHPEFLLYLAKQRRIFRALIDAAVQ